MPADERDREVDAEPDRLDVRRDRHVLPVRDVPVAGAPHRLVDDAGLDDAERRRHQQDPRPAEPETPGRLADQQRRGAVQRREDDEVADQHAPVAGAVVVAPEVLRTHRCQQEEAGRGEPCGAHAPTLGPAAAVPEPPWVPAAQTKVRGGSAPIGRAPRDARRRGRRSAPGSRPTSGPARAGRRRRPARAPSGGRRRRPGRTCGPAWSG